MIDATVFIPREYHRALAVLGKRRWYELHPRTPEPGSIGVHNLGVRNADFIATATELKDPADIRALKVIYSAVSREPIFCETIMACARFIADGPKLFRPTLMQCEALSQVEVNLTLADYAQPYPALAIEVPAPWADKLEVPRHVVVFLDDNPRHFSAFAGNIMRGNGPDHVINSFTLSNPAIVIESLLGVETVEFIRPPTETELQNRKLLWRVCMNCALALTMYPTRVAPLDAAAVDKLTAMRRRKGPEERARAARLLAGQFTEVILPQDIKFHETENAGPVPGIELPAVPGEPAERHAKPPHWRKGHFRRQPYGPPAEGRRKLIMIKAVFVRRDLFLGRIADTNTEYRS